MATAEVTLPSGVWRENARHRSAGLRWPAEAGERAMVEETAGLLPAARVTELIARCVEVAGAAGGDVARELTAGDRVALLFQLRRLACGDALTCVFPCPNADCREPLELELRVSDLLVEPDGELPPVHELRFGDRLVRFRLPTGADEERAAVRALNDPQAAVDELLATCLVEAPEPSPPELRERIAEAMGELDPQADVTLALQCPECEREGIVRFDPAAYLFDELEARTQALERDVHVLASGYGWSEDEILALPPVRRRRYVERLEASR
jgi:hypothetical protein